jgi:hypothetical protein
MAEFKQIIITEKGQALLAKMMTGASGVQYVDIVASSHAYTMDELEALVTLQNVMQTTLVSNVTRTSPTAVKIEGAMNNIALTEGYYCRTVGVSAMDPDEGKILYGVTITDTPDYIPAFNGVTNTGLMLELIISVGNADSVTLEVDPAAVATVAQLVPINSAITGFKELAGYNQLINGGMDVCQRGTSHTLQPNQSRQTTGIDRFSCSLQEAYGNPITVERSEDVPPGISVRYSMKITVPVDFNDTAITDFYILQKSAEISQFRGKTMTFSAWVKGPQGAVTQFSINSSKWYYPIFTGDWQFLSVTGEVSQSFNGDLGILRNRAGTLCDIKAGDYYITAVKLEFGSVPTPYVPRLYSEDLALCQWYYYNISTRTLDDWALTGVSTGAFSVIVTPPVFPMRITPTLQISDLSASLNLRPNGSSLLVPWSNFLSVVFSANHYNLRFGNFPDSTFPPNSVIGFAAQPNCKLALNADMY